MWGAQLEVIAPFQLFPRRKGNALLKENNHYRENVSHSSALLEATPSFCMSSSREGEYSGQICAVVLRESVIFAPRRRVRSRNASALRM